MKYYGEPEEVHGAVGSVRLKSKCPNPQRYQEREGQDRLLVSGSVLVTEGDGHSRETQELQVPG